MTEDTAPPTPPAPSPSSPAWSAAAAAVWSAGPSSSGRHTPPTQTPHHTRRPPACRGGARPPTGTVAAGAPHPPVAPRGQPVGNPRDPVDPTTQPSPQSWREGRTRKARCRQTDVLYVEHHCTVLYCTEQDTEGAPLVAPRGGVRESHAPRAGGGGGGGDPGAAHQAQPRVPPLPPGARARPCLRQCAAVGG